MPGPPIQGPACGIASCPPVDPAPTTPPVLNDPKAWACGVTVVYRNTQQTAVNSCPDGSPTPPIYVTVEANRFTSTISQQAADDAALAFAQLEADEERVLVPCQNTPPPGNNLLVTEGGDFIMTESGDFLTT